MALTTDAKSETKAAATTTSDTKKTLIAKTVIHVGPADNFKVFQKGEEVKGVSKEDLEYLKKIGEVIEA